jgi:Uma2 family endonuclease
VHTGSDDRSGGRQPDLTLWPVGHEHRKVHNDYVDPSAMLAAVEIVSRSSRSIDKREKRDEYASVGIPVYLIVDDDEPHTVTVLNLAEEAYEITTRVSLARLLSAYDPKEVFGG